MERRCVAVVVPSVYENTSIWERALGIEGPGTEWE